ncbi:MAG: insulinase family protein [Gammaproteobacteria bacterium]|nr:insulinase family protein [Gammaproteobacteria bacterium]MDH4254137.1 insulinase family protein [Gammaproteobacteria bacterium]MDH5309496.1 insulinase family protein [Gammaproteobacteria bacterium]
MPQCQTSEGRNFLRPARLARLLVLVSVFATTGAGAALDLANASRERLPNGLTLIVLEDRNFPVVSVQMLYRVGARDETTGVTGLAHFLEHMAFRSSEQFPGTGLVSSIYAVGGEWHGYTWLDQTTYFATVPRDELDLLLRIEADRMARLTLSADDMEAERGAVLAEMHMYENYPTSMLIDAVMFASFQAHPYRNNTIGWESDIENLRHQDVVEFYRRHYRPANGVLAVVGDVDASAVRARVAELFGDLPAQDATPLPHTVEPVQHGERRIRLRGPAEESRFLVAYRAPSASSPDFAAFLVLQELLGGSSGISFLQNDWGTAVRPGSALHGAADGLTTWYPPSAQDYVFTIGGSAAPGADEAQIEAGIEARVARLRAAPVDESRLDAAIEAVRDQLVFDVATTEDAAHQLAFFEGLDAYDVLLALPGRLHAVDPRDVQRVAERYLLPERRTIGWYVPGERRLPSPPSADGSPLPPGPAAAPVDEVPAGEPQVVTLGGGLPVILQPSDLSSSVYVWLQLPAGAAVPGEALSVDPHTGLPALAAETRPAGLEALLTGFRQTLSAAGPPEPDRFEPAADPETRLAKAFDRMMAAPAQAERAAPLFAVIAGDFEPVAALALLERSLGDLAPGAPGAARTAGNYRGGDVTESLGVPVAQAQLGYLVPAPPPAEADAWRLLLYVLSHGYGGRLGDNAISRQGLAYYIDANYRSDGTEGWISLATGVDPAKLGPLVEVLEAELGRLASEPPGEAELDEARSHFAGRAQSAAQSNAELAADLARRYAWYGELRPLDDRIERWRAVERADVIEAIPAFVSGAKVIVRE